jgi:hypothetical protein
MYQVTLACKGVPIALGPSGAVDVTEEFSHRSWHQNVRCEWNGEELMLCAQNDWDGDAKALFGRYDSLHPGSMWLMRSRSDRLLLWHKLRPERTPAETDENTPMKEAPPYR